MFNVGRKLAVGKTREPFIANVSMPDLAKITDVCNRAISIFEAASGKKIDRNKPVTAFLVSNIMSFDESTKKGTYFNGEIKTFQRLKQVVNNNFKKADPKVQMEFYIEQA